MKKLFSAIAASGVLMLAASHVSANEKLVFGITLEPYPPFSMKAGNGEWQGFEPDLVRALCVCRSRPIARSKKFPGTV